MNEQETTKRVPLAIAGCAGRMGQRLCALAEASLVVDLFEAFEYAGHETIGQLAVPASDSELVISEAFTGRSDVLIDFTTPEATRVLIDQCVASETALVIGTTGLTDDDQQLIQEAAAEIPLVVATNFSLVVNVLNVLSAQAAQLLGDAYDIEIVEAHHRFKKDAPSGTALTLARAVCDATDRSFDDDVVCERHGDDVVRRDREITVQALRLGDVVGEHTVMFAAPGERMELRHIGTSRDSYAAGAIHAAHWVCEKPPGLYTMNDVLGLPSI